MNRRLLYVFAASALLMTGTAAMADSFIIVASTTSTENSGLFEFMLPKFEAQSGIDVRVIAVGTGQAIKTARNCDADVLFVHHKPSEQKFVADGYGVKRHDVMYNDYVIVGPGKDPAGVKGMKDANGAFKKIAGTKSPFASRGDDSGTHKKELSLWKAAGIDAPKASGAWYRETGSGMGATLNTGSGMNAYALTDRGTWLSFKNRGELAIVVEGDERLFNPYGIILVNSAKCPKVKSAAGQKFIDWVISPKGQRVINDFKIEGQQAFFASAK